jgi:hypothetical protein
MQILSDDVVELLQVYDGIDAKDQTVCSIGTNYNANKTCTLTFTAPEDMKPPVMIYYQLTNFHQNHRSYAFSRNDYQLTGGTGEEASVDECVPLSKLGNQTLNPCGLIANTFFNDQFTLQPGSLDDTGEELIMREDGISWQSDREFRFSQPHDFQMEQCPDDMCNAQCCEDFGFSCTEPAISKKDGNCYAYHYPNEDTTRYLYETYPQISPLDGITDEHFIVWMRVATRPTFRKLYGYIEQTIPKGTVLNFQVNANYVVESFGGSKAMIVTTNNIFGGKNDIVGVTFYAVGFFCLGVGLLFAAKHWFRPRKLADRKYLHYKED